MEYEASILLLFLSGSNSATTAEFNYDQVQQLLTEHAKKKSSMAHTLDIEHLRALNPRHGVSRIQDVGLTTERVLVSPHISSDPNYYKVSIDGVATKILATFLELQQEVAPNTESDEDNASDAPATNSELEEEEDQVCTYYTSAV